MKIFFAAVAFAAAGMTMPQAAPLPAREGAVVLTIKGNVENANSDAGAIFDSAMLERIAGRSATFETPWINQPTRFEGPFLKAVLDAAGAEGKTIPELYNEKYFARSVWQIDEIEVVD